VEVIGGCRAVSAIVNWLAGCRVTLSPFVDNSDLATGPSLARGGIPAGEPQPFGLPRIIGRRSGF
jgi:hypothetical protein